MTQDIVFHVSDMTCDHCARAIEAAVGAAEPGSVVQADAKAKTVRVSKARAPEAVMAAIASAGYSPKRL